MFNAGCFRAVGHTQVSIREKAANRVTDVAAVDLTKAGVNSGGEP
jgi:hypothetical protein